MFLLIYEYMFIYKRCKCEGKPTSLPIGKALKSLPALLKLISVPSRLSILCLLNSGPHCVCDMQTHSKMSQTLISHHLSDLSRAGLIKSTKNGQFVDYSLTKKGATLVSHLKRLVSL